MTRELPREYDERWLNAPALYHFTCGHGRAGIGKRGLIVPAKALHHVDLVLARVTWLTSDPEPDREAVGLTSNTIECDRMAFRYLVLQPWRCEPWTGSRYRAEMRSLMVADLETGRDPAQWWITAQPVLAELDPPPLRGPERNPDPERRPK